MFVYHIPALQAKRRRLMATSIPAKAQPRMKVVTCRQVLRCFASEMGHEAQRDAGYSCGAVADGIAERLRNPLFA